LWGVQAGNLYQLAYPTEGTKSRLAHPTRSVKCSMCDFVGTTPTAFAQHVLERHYETAQRHLRAATLETWEATTMELANLMAQKVNQN
jgi:glutamate synthase domain-containing protein 3